MGIIDLRPQATENDEADAAVLDEPIAQEVDEAPEPEATEPEEASDGTSAVEEKESEPEPVVDTKEDDARAVAALRAEREKIRKEISELRTERRQARAEAPKDVVVPDLSDVADADVALIEKVLAAKGYVKKEEIGAMTHNEKIEAHKDAWLAKHPEYLPENDADDANWNSLSKAVSDWFKKPANPQDISKILDAAHAMVSPAKLPTGSPASAAAAKEKVKATSAGSGSAPKAAKPKSGKALDLSYLHGFTDEEKAEFIN